jgi:hypothetical protein
MSFAITAWLCIFAAYIVPSSIALHRAHPRARWIVMVNLVLGLTWMGWIFALGWAMAGASCKALTGASLVVTGLVLWHEWPTSASQAAPSLEQQACLGGPGIPVMPRPAADLPKALEQYGAAIQAQPSSRRAITPAASCGSPSRI